LSDDALWDEMFGALKNSARPLVLVGGGIRAPGQLSLRTFVRKTRLPTVNSLMAVMSYRGKIHSELA
jgi:thiamine pyrophosphate-dependent acetolactate synthase large subunit-like protein